MDFRDVAVFSDGPSVLFVLILCHHMENHVDGQGHQTLQGRHIVGRRLLMLFAHEDIAFGCKGTGLRVIGGNRATVAGGEEFEEVERFAAAQLGEEHPIRLHAERGGNQFRWCDRRCPLTSFGVQEMHAVPVLGEQQFAHIFDRDEPFLLRDRLTDRFHERGFARACVPHDGNILFGQHRRINEPTQLTSGQILHELSLDGIKLGGATIQCRRLGPDIAVEGSFCFIFIQCLDPGAGPPD